MSKALQRKTVYAATIIALLTLAAGFAVATAVTTFVISPPTNGSSYGSGTVTNPGTIYEQSVATGYTNSAPVSSCSSASPAASTSATQTLYYGSGLTGAGACAPGDLYLTLTFTTSGPLTAGTPYSDTFSITVTPGTGSPTPVAFSASWDLTPTSSIATLTVDLDLGSNSATAVTVSVAGS